jgi:hypothetical protein
LIEAALAAMVNTPKERGGAIVLCAIGNETGMAMRQLHRLAGLNAKRDSVITM